MVLTEEQIQQVKEQLLQQIEKFPAEQREAAKQQIEAMDAEQLEEFLEKNKLIKKSGEQGGGCIFCSIAKGETPSYKIDENKSAVAVLDIAPVSEGHSLVVLKEHKPVEEIPSSLKFAKKLSTKLKAKLKSDDIKIESSSVQGHGIINVIPLYKDIKLEKKKASEEELQELQKKLIVKHKEIKPKKKSSKISELPKVPIRIP